MNEAELKAYRAKAKIQWKESGYNKGAITCIAELMYEIDVLKEELAGVRQNEKVY